MACRNLQKLDCLVNNAGVIRGFENLYEARPEDIDAAITGRDRGTVNNHAGVVVRLAVAARSAHADRTARARRDSRS